MRVKMRFGPNEGKEVDVPDGDAPVLIAEGRASLVDGDDEAEVKAEVKSAKKAQAAAVRAAKKA